jgi:hypothetical protein
MPPQSRLARQRPLILPDGLRMMILSGGVAGASGILAEAAGRGGRRSLFGRKPCVSHTAERDGRSTDVDAEKGFP